MIEGLVSDQFRDFPNSDEPEKNEDHAKDNVRREPVGTHRRGKGDAVVQVEKRRRHERNAEAAEDRECDDDHQRAAKEGKGNGGKRHEQQPSPIERLSRLDCQIAWIRRHATQQAEAIGENSWNRFPDADERSEHSCPESERVGVEPDRPDDGGQGSRHTRDGFAIGDGNSGGVEDAIGNEHHRDSEDGGEELGGGEIKAHRAEIAWIEFPLIAQQVVVTQQCQRSADPADE